MTVTTRVHHDQVTRRLGKISPEAPEPPIRFVIAGSLEPAVRWTGFTTPVLLTGCRSPLLAWTGGGLAEDDALSTTVKGTVTATRRGPQVFEGFNCSLVLGKLSLCPSEISEINTRRGPFEAREGGK